jgi:D-sedoheptulose 7-phosphate isomerase
MTADGVTALAASRCDAELDEAVRVVQSLRAQLGRACHVADLMITALRAGGKVLACGNGGSALEAQHFAAELLGHFRAYRPALAAVALTTEPGVLTAISNDFSYADVFARQVQGLARPGDVLVVFSTSGRSANVLAATRAARDLGVLTVALTGGDGGQIAALADHALVVASAETARIQEGHLILLHIICDRIDMAFRGADGEGHHADR